MFRFVFLSVLYSVIEADFDGLKECPAGDKVPFKCLFMTKTERTTLCCFPVSKPKRPSTLAWNDEEKVENGFISASLILNEKCPNILVVQEIAYMSCLPREGISDIELSPYPIQRSQFSKYTEEQAEPFYCSDAFKSVYDVVLTCWLYDCEARLKIPQKAKGLEKKAKKCDVLCLPPILHKENPKKYCTLYTTKIPEKRPCEWPPICGKYEKIDKSEYLVPLINGKPDPEYCEVLCPSNYNTGENDEKPCRQVPICPANQTSNVLTGAAFDNEKTNPYKMHTCYPFCTPEDSQFLDPKRRKGKHSECQPLPPCKNGKPDPPFTGSNPFGANTCIEIKDSTDSGEPRVYFILMCILAPLVLIMTIALVVLLVLLRRKSEQNKILTGNANGVGVGTTAENASSMENAPKSHSNSGRQDRVNKNPKRRQRAADNVTNINIKTTVASSEKAGNNPEPGQA